MTKIDMRLIIKQMQMRSPYINHAARGLPNPTHLEGEVRFIQAQFHVRLKQYMSRRATKPTKRQVRPTKTQISLGIRQV